MPVRFDQRVGDLVRDVAREPDRHRPRGGHHLEVSPGYQFHYEVRDGRAVWSRGRLFAGIDRGDDVRVLELADRARFLEEPRERSRVVLGGRVECLNRDRAAQLAVFAAIDHAHPAGADAVEDAVVAEHHPV